ncbi:MAG: hypothetical protein HFH60_05030 [Lachnospiraceae bacterium]|nr:hypothetical protein [Lachnospiraceae bacterium]
MKKIDTIPAIPANPTNAEKKPEVYIQYGDKEVDIQDVLDKIKEQWTKDLENEADDLKELKVYIKPEDNAAYYVINGDITGSFGL